MKSQEDSKAKIIQQNDIKSLRYIIVNKNISFIATRKKQKIDDNINHQKETSSLISGLHFAEEMGLITQPPLSWNKPNDVPYTIIDLCTYVHTYIRTFVPTSFRLYLKKNTYDNKK